MAATGIRKIKKAHGKRIMRATSRAPDVEHGAVDEERDGGEREPRLQAARAQNKEHDPGGEENKSAIRPFLVGAPDFFAIVQNESEGNERHELGMFLVHSRIPSLPGPGRGRARAAGKYPFDKERHEAKKIDERPEECGEEERANRIALHPSLRLAKPDSRLPDVRITGQLVRPPPAARCAAPFVGRSSGRFADAAGRRQDIRQ